MYALCRNWDSPQPPRRRLVCPLPPVSGGRGTLAVEKGVGRVPIPTRGIHCGTLYMYVLCGTEYSAPPPLSRINRFTVIPLMHSPPFNVCQPNFDNFGNFLRRIKFALASTFPSTQHTLCACVAVLDSINETTRPFRIFLVSLWFLYEYSIYVV